MMAYHVFRLIILVEFFKNSFIEGRKIKNKFFKNKKKD